MSKYGWQYGLVLKKTMPFIKKHLIKLQLKFEIQREAMNKK